MKLLNVDCDLAGKKVVVGENVLVSIDRLMFAGTITYVSVGDTPERIEVRAGRRELSSLYVGEDHIARGMLTVR